MFIKKRQQALGHERRLCLLSYYLTPFVSVLMSSLQVHRESQAQISQLHKNIGKIGPPRPAPGPCKSRTCSLPQKRASLMASWAGNWGLGKGLAPRLRSRQHDPPPSLGPPTLQEAGCRDAGIPSAAAGIPEAWGVPGGESPF